MLKTRHVYTVYIASTAERVWEAIVKGDVTRQYWGYENASDWKVGSRWEHRKADGSGTVALVGEVIEVTPPQRLVITWAPPAVAEHSRVTFEIESLDKLVRLTVTHDELEAGSDMERGIEEGWPRVLSSMKTFLETGKPLDTWAGKRS